MSIRKDLILVSSEPECEAEKIIQKAFKEIL